MTDLLRIAVSSCMMHPDPSRNIFKGKRLLYMEESMFHWVSRNGAAAFLLPTAAENLSLESMLSLFDGLILSGGVDMAPQSYGEMPLHPDWAGDAIRDEYDVKLLKSAIKQNIPVLGVCRGAQVINVGLGGTLYQDISTQKKDALVHRDWEIYDQNFHEIQILEGGILSSLAGGTKKTFRTNSVHHQGVKDLANSLIVEAVSPNDGLIEGFRLDIDSKDGFVFGVQWHPEFQNGDADFLSADRLMRHFLDQCRTRQKI
jgi:putative glutamine amidotransferase